MGRLYQAVCRPLAIAWIYRADYCRAGLRMLPSVNLEGGTTGWQMICYCLALLAASLTPFVIGRAGPVYSASARSWESAFCYARLALPGCLRWRVLALCCGRCWFTCQGC
jgi:heme O synthase-like polyprenyltransferase